MAKPEEIEISSFAAPTAEDVALLERLTESECKDLIAREIRKGIESGISETTMADIWAEALRRTTAKAQGA